MKSKKLKKFIDLKNNNKYNLNYDYNNLRKHSKKYSTNLENERSSIFFINKNYKSNANYSISDKNRLKNLSSTSNNTNDLKIKKIEKEIINNNNLEDKNFLNKKYQYKKWNFFKKNILNIPKANYRNNYHIIRKNAYHLNTNKLLIRNYKEELMKSFKINKFK